MIEQFSPYLMELKDNVWIVRLEGSPRILVASFLRSDCLVYLQRQLSSRVQDARVEVESLEFQLGVVTSYLNYLRE